MTAPLPIGSMAGAYFLLRAPGAPSNLIVDPASNLPERVRRPLALRGFVILAVGMSFLFLHLEIARTLGDEHQDGRGIPVPHVDVVHDAPDLGNVVRRTQDRVHRLTRAAKTPAMYPAPICASVVTGSRAWVISLSIEQEPATTNSAVSVTRFRHVSVSGRITSVENRAVL